MAEEKLGPPVVTMEVSGEQSKQKYRRPSSTSSNDALVKGGDEVNPPFPFGIFLFAYAGWAFDFMDLVLVATMKQYIAKTFGLTDREEAWMLGVALGTSGLGGMIAGGLADRFGKRTLMASTILLYSIGSLIAGLAPNFAVFMVGRGVVGLGAGGEWAIGHAMVAEAIGKHRRGVGSALLQTGEPVGMLMAAIAGFYIAPHTGWRAIMCAMSATALLAVFVRRSMKLPDTVITHRVPYSRLCGKTAITMLAAFILAVLKLATYWTCYTWLPTFLHKHMHQSMAKSFQWVATSQLGQFVGMCIFGNVSDLLGRRPTFTIYGGITAAAVGALAFRWHDLLANHGSFWTVMFFLGVGSGCTGGLGALLAELFPTEVRALAMGTTYNLARSVQVVSPYVVERALESGGLTGALSVPMCLAIGMAIWVWVFPETKGIELPAWEDDHDLPYVVEEK